MIIGWICIVLGAYVAGRSLRAIVRGILSRKWPAVQGTLRKSKRTEDTNSEGDRIWRLDVEYAFDVNGKTFRGKRVHFGLPLRTVWSDVADAPRAGDRVTVVYNPSRPSISALRRGVHPFAIIPLIVGVGLLWVGWLALR
jgi:hypothetical protein